MATAHTSNIFQILGRHPIHPFPARMAPGIALEALGDETSLRVLDPMVGSGTVLAVARAKGHHAFGVDLDPLAVLLAGVWTRTVDAQAVNDNAREVLDRARALFRSRSSGSAYPCNSDEETRIFCRFWFDEYARRQLSALAHTINQVRDQPTRDVLWSGFSRLIITKQAGASLAMDLSHSRPHKSFKYAPVKPFNKFLSAVYVVTSNCPQSGSEALGPPSVVKNGDARKLDYEDGTIDLVLTSPPYLNAIDYIRCSKFSLVWMGYKIRELRQVRSTSIGTERPSKDALNHDWVDSMIRDLQLLPALCKRDQGLLATYIWDMGTALAEVSRVLRRGGRAVYVVGDCSTRGTFIPNSSIVRAVAERNGLSLVSKRSRDLPANRRYLPPPKDVVSAATLDSRLRREIVLTFSKS